MLLPRYQGREARPIDARGRAKTTAAMWSTSLVMAKRHERRHDARIGDLNLYR